MKKQLISFAHVDELTLAPVEDTLYELGALDLLEKKTLTVKLKVPSSSCKIVCNYRVGRKEFFDLTTTVVHQAPNTFCEIRIRGVLADGGISTYVGKVVVAKAARGAVARLDDKVLVIGSGIRNHAEPIMQIETNEVTAIHTTSISRIDAAQLYYLQSRGLAQKEAEMLLADAFLASSETDAL
ncbi:SufD family Fe-S cluster assembly protein [Patescibacteria group bacterium]|nr:SufD family Fe-S cluster assembly protein [Patescibacteria group bacterium]MBU1970555.1 SufD family Fe-S cluster assembly protein [Patescibacteria group bacterium]